MGKYKTTETVWGTAWQREICRGLENESNEKEITGRKEEVTEALDVSIKVLFGEG